MRALGVLLLVIFSVASNAQSSPEGVWMSFDDDGVTPTALVRISKLNGQLVGRIERVLEQSAEPTCSKCVDDRKNQPLLGLEIIRGVSPEPKNGKWEQGRILDPEDGSDYKLVMELKDGGEVLSMRGYWGVFWRTQQWRRQSM